MSLTATEPNPRKTFSFEVEGGGIPMALVQKVKLPSVEFTSAEHGDGNRTVTTASRKNIGDAELEKLLPADGADTWLRDWMALVENGLPSDYKEDLVIRQYGPDQTTVVGAWRLYGCWPKKVEYSDLERKSDDNAVEKVTLAVDGVEQVV